MPGAKHRSRYLRIYLVEWISMNKTWRCIDDKFADDLVRAAVKEEFSLNVLEELKLVRQGHPCLTMA